MFGIIPNKTDNARSVDDKGKLTLAPPETVQDEFALNVQYLEKNDENKRKALDKLEEHTDSKKVKHSIWPFHEIRSKLQAASHEARQLLQLIDLIHLGNGFEVETVPRQPKTITREFLDLESIRRQKQIHVIEVQKQLKSCKERLSGTRQKENTYMEFLKTIQSKWRIVAPAHGKVISTLRAEEPIAIDCSYTTVGKNAIFRNSSEARIYQDSSNQICLAVDKSTLKTILFTLKDQKSGEIVSSCDALPYKYKSYIDGMNKGDINATLSIVSHSELMHDVFALLQKEVSVKQDSEANRNYEIMELFNNKLIITAGKTHALEIQLIDVFDAEISVSKKQLLFKSLGTFLVGKFRKYQKTISPFEEKNEYFGLVEDAVGFCCHHFMCQALQKIRSEISRYNSTSNMEMAKAIEDLMVSATLIHTNPLVSVFSIRIGDKFCVEWNVVKGTLENIGVAGSSWCREYLTFHEGLNSSNITQLRVVLFQLIDHVLKELILVRITHSLSLLKWKPNYDDEKQMIMIGDLKTNPVEIQVGSLEKEVGCIQLSFESPPNTNEAPALLCIFISAKSEKRIPWKDLPGIHFHDKIASLIGLNK